jgi:hypothetical protein
MDGSFRQVYLKGAGVDQVGTLVVQPLLQAVPWVGDVRLDSQGELRQHNIIYQYMWIEIIIVIYTT